MKHFKFWCYKVLPLVYDDSLSYYEVLCKVVKYINDLIDSDKEIIEDVEQLQSEMAVVQDWIKNFNTSYLEKIVKDYITKTIKTVTFGISSAGYFMACIPDSWSDIKFSTIQDGDLYGHLVLSYD